MKAKKLAIWVVTVLLVGLFVYSLFFSTPKYTVSFNTDGGNKIADVKVKKNNTVEKPADPTKEGYTFKEWQLDGETYTFTTQIIKNIELKAVWEENKVEEKTTTKKTTTKKTTTKKTTTKKTTTTKATTTKAN